MNYKMLGKFLGAVLLIEAAFLIMPTAVSLIYGESVAPFLLTAAILLAFSLPTLALKPKNRRIYAKDGFICVASSWIFLSLFGALPFVFSGAIPSFIDAVFESVSGFTTTGATILPDIEVLPRGILFWRSLTHWIGGMGILVFMLAILSNLDGNAIFLMRAEVPGPQKGKLVSKLSESSKILYVIYLVLTALEILALLIARLDLYDAMIVAFGTLGTGGFATLNDSIAGYASPAVEWIVGIFLFLGGINYNMYFFLFVRKFKEVRKNEELRAYITVTLVSSAVIVINLMKSAGWTMGFGETVRAAFFQVTSIMSTAGFTTAAFNTWPHLSQSIIFILMILGACAGSTAGGFKISRALIVFKAIRREIRRIFKPNSVEVLELDGNTLDESTVKSAMNYMSIYFITIILSFLVVSINGKDILTNLSAVITTFNNVGPAFGEAFSSFTSFDGFSKFIFILDMLFGRLEIMPMLVLLSPAAWRRS